VLDIAAGGRSIGAVTAGGAEAVAPTAEDLLGLVDRLAAAGADRCTALARERIRAAVAAGAAPPGLRRLAEALGTVRDDGPTAAVTDLPPPRPPVDGPAPGPVPIALVEAMRGTALALLESTDPAAVASAVGALVEDGRRVIVTAADPVALAAVRDALAPGVHRRSLDRLPALSPADLRELRRLLTGATPGRRARAEQRLPAAEALPAADEVAELCARAVERVEHPDTGPVPPVLDEVLAGLDAGRRAAVVALADAVVRALAAMPPRDRHPWAWRLLPELVLNQRREALDELFADAGAAVLALDEARTEPPVIVTGRVPDDALATLGRYLEFLEGGGRRRSCFRSPAQRDVQPVLSRTSVGSRRAETPADVRRVIDHLETAGRLRRVDARCAQLGLRAPRNELELIGLTGDLAAVTAAVTAVAALRHDVLFLAADSPVPVPDLDSATGIARAVLAAEGRGGVEAAACALDQLAVELAPPPGAVPAAEVDRVVAALRARDAAGYAAAVAELVPARREAADEARCRALLRTLGEAAPRLADAWSVGRFGLAAFVPVEDLLAALPPPDSADVVVVHRAADLGYERLLLAAVAPRLVATAERGRPVPEAGLLGVLRRVAVPVARP
jgi:hypothetical protein